jgi:hypothetical protein
MINLDETYKNLKNDEERIKFKIANPEYKVVLQDPINDEDNALIYLKLGCYIYLGKKINYDNNK